MVLMETGRGCEKFNCVVNIDSLSWIGQEVGSNKNEVLSRNII